MASNFEIAISKACDGFDLKLIGDFDATSAYELIYAIMKLPKKAKRLNVYTDDLRNIHLFGLEVFHRSIQLSRMNSAKIVFNGKHSSQLSNALLLSKRSSFATV